MSRILKSLLFIKLEHFNFTGQGEVAWFVAINADTKTPERYKCLFFA